MVRKAKELVEAKGILSTLNPEPGKMLKDGTVKFVPKFYDDDEICRRMSGKKDFSSVTEDGKRVNKKNLLLLCNLNEAYSLFKQQYPNVKVGFSKFCEIMPRNIVTAGACGTD
jgi:hypothetical protein